MTVIAASSSPADTYLGSPSIIELASGRLVVAHDVFGPGAPVDGNGAANQSAVYYSDDDGLTWTHSEDITGAFWGSLFILSADLYLISVDALRGNQVLRKCTDQSTLTWSTPVTLDAVHTCSGAGGQPPVVHSGYVWTSWEHVPDPESPWPQAYQIIVARCPEASDPMVSPNWSLSTPLPFPAGWAPTHWSAPAWLESQPVVMPDGTLKLMARVHADPEDTPGWQALVDVDAVTGVPTANRLTRAIGGNGKTQWHTIDGRIWAVANRRIYGVGAYPHYNSRNVLALLSSVDGVNWQCHKQLWSDYTDPRQYCRQYIAWIIDSAGDLLIAARENDASGDSCHNSNLLSFYRYADWRSGWHEVER